MDDTRTTTPHLPPRDPGPRGSAVGGRRRRGLAMIAMGAILIGGWVLTSAQQRSQVVVWYDALPVDCEGADAPIESLFDEDADFVAILEASPGLDCALRLHVGNRGRLTARLGEVTLPLHGPGTGASVQATSLAPYGLFPLAETSQMPGLTPVDAVFALDQPLAAGEQVTLRIRLEFVPGGCMSPGALQWSDDMPIIEVSVLRLTGTRAPVGAIVAQRGTDDSSCDAS